MSEPVPLGARLLLIVAMLMWACMRWPLLADFCITVRDQPARVVANDLPLYLAVADAFIHHGRLGQYDVHRVVPLQGIGDPALDYRRWPETQPPEWRFFDYNDWGYALTIAAGWTLFFPLRANLYSGLAFQYLVDLLCLLGVCWMATRLVSPWAGALAALLYALHPSLISVAHMPYYYFWSVPAVCGALVCWTTAFQYHRPVAGVPGAGLCLGLGTLIRTTNAALVILFGAWLLLRRDKPAPWWRLEALLALGFVLPLLPVVATKFHTHGRLQMTGREVFYHSVLCGLGLHDNPWGLRYDDNAMFERIRAKYGVRFDMEHPQAYEAACKLEVQSMWRERPDVFVRNFFLNVMTGLGWHTAIPPDQDLPKVHRLLANMQFLLWLGCLLLLLMRKDLHWWLGGLLAALLYPIVVIAPIIAPNYAYVCSLYAVEVLLAGMGVGLGLQRLCGRLSGRTA